MLRSLVGSEMCIRDRYNLLHAVRRELGTELPFDVISGYRSPHTNETLRTTRGGGVAKRSLHMDGKAIDKVLATRVPAGEEAPAQAPA